MRSWGGEAMPYVFIIPAFVVFETFLTAALVATLACAQIRRSA